MIIRYKYIRYDNEYIVVPFIPDILKKLEVTNNDHNNIFLNFIAQSVLIPAALRSEEGG